ncbi:MAG: preprotein translocase subunit YajC [Candidatus Omnitrophica bacterium]|nr:preprotein translocase subunit YajC [Candidatus Omnitrophota bacterium]
MPDPAAAAPSSSLLLMQYLVPFGMMFLIFYLIVFRPQSKARKEHEAMLKALKKNDEVVTTGGIFGTVLNVKPESVTLRVDDNVRLEVERAAIARVAKARPA